MTEFLALPNGIRFVNGAFDLETETANTPLSLNAALENFRGFIVLNNNPTGKSIITFISCFLYFYLNENCNKI